MISFSSVESLSVDDDNVSFESRGKDDGIELNSLPQSISPTSSSSRSLSSADDVQVTPGEGETKESVHLLKA